MDAILSTHRQTARLAATAALGALLLSALPARSAEAAAEILPHRAIYKMSLLKARSSSKIADVNGRMMFEWADACDGWTTEQRFQLRFAYVEGDEMNMTTNYTTWEAKNGLRYRFNVRKTVNGETDEEVRGDARLEKDGSGGVAHFIRPEENDMPLPAGTLFPSSHTVQTIERAKTGEVLFNRIVFDGADAEGATEISAVIGPSVAAKGVTGPELTKGRKGWPVRMAFFPLKSDNAQPEYEMSITLLQNGVAESMQIDYGDFIVNAILETLEALPKSGC